jgi:MFS family permease
MPAAIVTRWPLVLLVVGAGIAVAFQIGKVPAALPALRADLGLGLVAAGWVISMFNVVGLAIGMLAGALAARFGDRAVALVGLALVAAASATGAAATGPFLLLATRFVEGLGFIMVVVAAPSLIVRLTAPDDRRLAFGAWGAYNPAGTALMIVLSPLLLLPFGWRGLWLANFVLVGLAALALAAATRGLIPGEAVLRDAPRPHAEEQSVSKHEDAGLLRTRPENFETPPEPAAGLWRDIRDTVTAPGPLALAVAFGAYAFNFLAVFGFLPTILVENEAMSQATAALLTAFAIVCNVAGNLAGGALRHRGVPRWALVATASLVMGAATLGIFAPPLPFQARYGLYIVFSLVAGLLPPAVFDGATAHAPRPALVPMTQGLLVQGANTGMTLGPPAVAALAAYTGTWAWSPAIHLAAAGIGVAAALVLRRIERRMG